MSRTVIGLVGCVDAGKTTIAKAILAMADRESIHASIHSFSEKLYGCLELIGVPKENLYDKTRRDEPLAQFGGKSAYEMLCSLGTNWGRDMVDPDIWVNATFAGLPEGGIRIFENTRFGNEADAVKTANGTLVFIDGPSEARDSDADRAAMALKDRCDFIVCNDLTRVPEAVAMDVLRAAAVSRLFKGSAYHAAS